MGSGLLDIPGDLQRRGFCARGGPRKFWQTKDFGSMCDLGGDLSCAGGCWEYGLVDIYLGTSHRQRRPGEAFRLQALLKQ